MIMYHNMRHDNDRKTMYKKHNMTRSYQCNLSWFQTYHMGYLCDYMYDDDDDDNDSSE